MTRKVKLGNRLSYTLIAFVSIILLGVGVYAFGTSNPTVFGHSIGELDWSSVIPQIKTNSLCLGAECKTNWSEASGGVPSGYNFVKTKSGNLQFLLKDAYSNTFNYKEGTMYHYCDFSFQNGVASVRARQDGGGWSPPQPCDSGWETDGDAYCQGPNGASWYTTCTVAFNSVAFTGCNGCETPVSTSFGIN